MRPSVDFSMRQFRRLLWVASLPQLRLQDGTEKQRQRIRDDARLTESRNARSEQLLVVPTVSLTNRVWLEWIRTSKDRLFFRYEISDLFFAVPLFLHLVHVHFLYLYLLYSCVCAYVMFLRMGRSIVNHTLYVAISVICKFHCVSICWRRQCVGLVDGRVVFRPDWTLPLLDAAYGVGSHATV